MPKRDAGFGIAWLGLSLSCLAHICDLTVNHFLDYYNATVLDLYGHFAGFPRLDLEFQKWLGALILTAFALFALTPLAFRNALWMRPIGHVFAAVALLESLAQIALTIRGHTTGSVQFDGVSPGFYTAPLLLVFAAFLFWNLRQSGAEAQRPSNG